ITLTCITVAKKFDIEMKSVKYLIGIVDSKLLNATAMTAMGVYTNRCCPLANVNRLQSVVSAVALPDVFIAKIIKDKVRRCLSNGRSRWRSDDDRRSNRLI